MQSLERKRIKITFATPPLSVPPPAPPPHIATVAAVTALALARSRLLNNEK